MQTLKTILFTLAGAVFVSSSQAQTFDAASNQADVDLKTSLVELAEVRNAITEEKIPLAKKIARVEDEVIRKREKLERLRRLRDNSDLGLNRLREQVESMNEQNDYAASLLDEFVRSFETRIDYSETQLYAEVTEDAGLRWKIPIWSSPGALRSNSR